MGIFQKSDWRSTAHYAKTTDIRVSQEMNKLIEAEGSTIDKSAKEAS